MKTKILDINGKEKASIELPKFFSAKVREDIVSKALETKKSEQPYSPSPVAGKQHAAKGKLVHRRHVWRSGYGRGMSRVPRKMMSRRGSQFGWEAAEVPHARGGMRAHPPKVISRINTLKMNKKEMVLALESAFSATANPKIIEKRYQRLQNNKIEAPFVIEDKITSLKTKDLLASLKKILGKELFAIALKTKKVRSGKGKTRGRKYKSSAGLLFVLGKKEKLKTNAFDVKRVDNVSILDLARGGVGRLTIYSEQAIKELSKENKSK
jgi:large subunit ribosomal protein L4e